MRSLALAALFASSIAVAQPAQKLPGGAVIKPGKPPPVVPLGPTEMKPLAPLVGNWVATSSAGASANVACATVAEGAWLSCEVRGPIVATVVIGFDRAAHGYRAFVADAKGSSRIYKGSLTDGALSLRADGSPRVKLASEVQPIVITIGSESWKLNPGAR
jgi:hypothetical protein